MNHTAGVRNGVFKCWFDTGTDEHIIQCTANFKDGFLDGESLGYYTDGNKRYRELYSGGTFQEKYSIYLGEDGKLITKEQFELQESDDELMEYFTKFNNLY